MTGCPIMEYFREDFILIIKNMSNKWVIFQKKSIQLRNNLQIVILILLFKNFSQDIILSVIHLFWIKFLFF